MAGGYRERERQAGESKIEGGYMVMVVDRWGSSCFFND